MSTVGEILSVDISLWPGEIFIYLFRRRGAATT